MSKQLAEVYGLDNLARAWRWLLTNPVAEYKNYFRDVYRAYSVAAEAHLADLHERLKRGVYEPTHACKLYFPKKSGILRPYTLLGIEDQIVYQGLTNIIAATFVPKVRHRYLKNVFGNLYTGKRSKFFYRRWQDCYRSFGDAIRQAYADGYRYAATFDLTACYDTIDHQVLGKFLQDVGVERDVVDFLRKCLGHWTAADPVQQIYQGHGIPQGPLSSGLVSEVVLARFDDTGCAFKEAKYFRYGDDIHLYAKSEPDLRHLLVELDLVSKSIGLFPQTSKIDIHRVSNVSDEIKSVSRPGEPTVRHGARDQARLRQRIVDLSRRYVIKNETRFKWVLGHAATSLVLSRRLLRLLQLYPHLHPEILRYFERYEEFPEEIARGLLTRLEEDDVYVAFSAALLRATLGRVPAKLVPDYVDCIRSRFWPPSWSAEIELAAACAAWLLCHRELSLEQTRKLATAPESWWFRKDMLASVDRAYLGDASYQHMLNAALRDKCADVAVVAAYALADAKLTVARPLKWDLNRMGKLTLKQFGLIKRTGGRICGVDWALKAMLGKSPCKRSWRTILGKRHSHAETILVRAKGYASTDPTRWVNMMDTFHDLLLDALFAHDGSLGSYRLGDLGAVLKDTGRLARSYPRLYEAVKDIHKKRGESELSHAQVRRTGKRTGPIKFKYRDEVRPLLLKAYHQLDSKW